MAEQIRQAVVFDFDCTLSTRHWYLFLYKFEHFQRIDKWNTQPELFTQLHKSIFASNLTQDQVKYCRVSVSTIFKATNSALKG